MDKDNKDIIYMRRALELAERGKGYVSTNPMVGAVIVYNDRIIGEGYHQKCGEAHAEVNAINSVREQDLKHLADSTMYVTLEPCSHWGKTPPCCDLIISKGIKRVVAAMQDPFAKVSGNGFKRMQENGIDVSVGILEDDARELNKRFLTYHEKKRPYIILKWARTYDGFIDCERQANEPSPWFTNHSCKVLVHKWRSEEDAIWVGKNTVLRDNPTLTVREWFGNNPIRISMENTKEIDSTYNICNSEAQTIIYHKESIEEMISDMYSRGIQSVFVEGGEYLLNYLIQNELFDEIFEFVSPKSIQEFGACTQNGTKAPKILHSKLIEKHDIGNTELNYYKNKNL